MSGNFDRVSFTFSTLSNIADSQNANGTAQQVETFSGDGDIRRKEVVSGICIQRDVEEGLGSVQMETPPWPIFLDDLQCFNRVMGGATECPIVQVPNIDPKTGYFLFDAFCDGL